MNKIPSLNRVEAAFFRQMDEIATGVMASLDEFADDVAGDVSPEVEQWLRRGAAIVQELSAHVMALAAASTARERADLVRALDALQARMDAHIAAQPKWRRRHERPPRPGQRHRGRRHRAHQGGACRLGDLRRHPRDSTMTRNGRKPG